MNEKNRGLRIQDSMYGIIDLNDSERKLIDSPSFQRLLSVKQLGFAYAAFPGGDYSRFSHCIGASHVMQKLVRTLQLEDSAQKVYRFAALIHDIGHFPFSHPIEQAIERRYEADATTNKPKTPFLNHEHVGAALLELDPKLREAIESANISPDVVARVFMKKDPTRHSALISSDIDADRLDYLRRTAHHTGLPYGCVDQDYIVREVRIDRENRVCWSRRALGALDHALIGRFYDYRQIVHNKTVVGLELVLKDVVYELTAPELKENGLDLSEAGVRQMIADKKWFRFDDHQLTEKIKISRLLETADRCFTQKCDALIDRNPPRLVGEKGGLLPARDKAHFEAFTDELKTLKPQFAKRFGIDESLWWVWTKKTTITSYEGLAQPSEDDEGTADLVRLLDHDGSSHLAVLDPQSLVGKLCTIWKFVARIYVLVERGHPKREEIEREIQVEMDAAWDRAFAGQTLLVKHAAA